MTNVRATWIAIAFIALTGTPSGVSAQTVYFVDRGAIGANDGSSWDDALVDLQDALAVAIFGDEIWVASGTYRPDRGTGDRDVPFNLPEGVRVFGGFNGTENRRAERSPTAHVTILSGDLGQNDGPDFSLVDDNSRHIVRISNAGIETTLDGFTITGGNADGLDPLTRGSGGGIYTAGGFTVRNCIVSRNTARRYGGGLFNLDGSPIIEDCAFRENRADFGGGVAEYGTGFGPLPLTVAGGIVSVVGSPSAQHGTPLLTRCRFIGNHATGFAGAMYTTGVFETPVVTACSFISNTTNHFGGAMVNDGGNHTIVSSLFIGNSAVERGGAIVNSTISSLTNCTMAFNSADVSGGIYSDFFRASIKSCVIWGNSDASELGETAQFGGTLPLIDFSCVQGPTLPGDGVGNITSDPFFKNPGGADATVGTEDDDFRISAASPCAQTGDPELTPVAGDKDLSGHGRILCGRVDMGAYEFGIGDITCDRVIDLVDFAQWAECRSPAIPVQSTCVSFDFDGDLDVDLVDFGFMQRSISEATP